MHYYLYNKNRKILNSKILYHLSISNDEKNIYFNIKLYSLILIILDFYLKPKERHLFFDLIIKLPNDIIILICNYVYEINSIHMNNALTNFYYKKWLIKP